MSEKPFKPAWWLRNPHLQTLWPVLFRRRIKLVLKRERFELADGDFVDADWVGEDNHAPIVLVLPGLEGSTNSPYAQGMLQALQQHGWRAMLLHFRGCSGELNRLPRTYHAGDTADLAAVVQILRARAPTTPLAAVGFSLGGNMLLKWLGETGDKNPLVAAVAVSVPLILEKSVQRINRGFSRIYQQYLLHHLRRKIHWKFTTQSQPAHVKIPPLTTLQTMRDFDDQITAPLHGFPNAEAYYAEASSYIYLHAIRVPTLLLQAKDDPFMTPNMLTVIKNSAHFKLELTEKGGHVGFVSGATPWRVRYWLEERIPTFLTKSSKNNFPFLYLKQSNKEN